MNNNMNSYIWATGLNIPFSGFMSLENTSCGLSNSLLGRRERFCFDTCKVKWRGLEKMYTLVLVIRAQCFMR